MHDIAVGVDGTEHAAEALRWAVEEGRTTGRPVTEVPVWGALDQHQPDGSRRFVVDYGQVNAETALATVVERVLGTDSADVGQAAVRSQAASGLLNAARHADMFVALPGTPSMCAGTPTPRRSRGVRPADGACCTGGHLIGWGGGVE